MSNERDMYSNWKPTGQMKYIEANGEKVLHQEWRGESFQIGYGMQYLHEWREIPVEQVAPDKQRAHRPKKG